MPTRATSAPVTAALIALVLLLAACGSPGASPESSPSADQTPRTTPSATAPGSDNPSSEPSATASTLVFTEQPFEGNPVAILADADQWVAVGASEDGAPTAWTSSDAVTWTPRAVPDPNPALREVDGFVGSVMGPMAKWGDTWFSFGTVIGCCDGRGVLAWRSTDGQTWEVIESQSPLFTDGYYIQQLVAHDDGLVAREIGFPVWSSRVWSWTPQDSWTASDLGDFDHGRTPLLLTGMAWDGERLVAVGGPFRGDYDAPPIGGVWVSPDGKRWEAIEVPSMSTAELGSVVAVPGGGFLATGQQDSVVSAWGSADGRTWEARSLPEVAGLTASHVVEAGDVLVALGFAEDRTAAWVSSDGIAWGAPAVLPPLDETRMVAGNADQVVIVGRERTPDGSGSTILFRASLTD
jgi:hypothetical protein